ncbi:MAG: phosphopantetheine-binding protein [Pseudomonadota bacterium]
MDRLDIEETILGILETEFEIVNPDKDANLAEKFDFDSIDALEVLIQVEEKYGPMTMDHKKQLFEYRTVNQICDYLTQIYQQRS